MAAAPGESVFLYPNDRPAGHGYTDLVDLFRGKTVARHLRGRNGTRRSGATATPSGWLPATGRWQSRSDFSGIFDLVMSAKGNADSGRTGGKDVSGEG